MGRIIKIKAATILETIVALVVVVILFSIAAGIIVNTNKATTSIQKIRAKEILQQYSQKTKDEKLFYEEEQKQAEFIIKREVNINKKYNSAIIARFTISDANGVKIHSWSEALKP